MVFLLAVMDDVFSITLPGEGTEPITGYSMP
jgi:hypothetical protein